MSSIPPPRVTPPPSVPPEPPDLPDLPPQREREVPWPIWTAPAAVLVGLVVGVFGSVVVAGIGAAAGGSKNSPAVNLVSDLVFDVGFVITALYFASLRRRPRPEDFGYRRIALALGVGACLAGGIGYYIVTAVYQALVHLHGSDKLPQSLGVGSSPAAIVTGMLFGLAHTGSAAGQYLIPLGFLGFVLCLVRWRTRSLYPCMALHSINNSLALGVNQLHWNAGEIVALVAASMAVVGA